MARAGSGRGRPSAPAPPAALLSFALSASAGFAIRATEDHTSALLEMARQIQTRLLGAEIMVGLKKLDLPGIDFTTAKEFLRAALDAIRQGNLGYAAILARRT